MFADTSIIPSTEPCLRCKCSNKNLVCVRRVCKDQPYPPPRSCILVYKKSMCCPYLSCSKYHINFYKNSERNSEHLNRLQVSHEKTLEKSSRTDDIDEETNGGCIESGSLYASGSAMVRSSSSLCSYCYCINGQQKCIKPKCELQNTKCKPIFMDASCCPVKYDCSSNATSSATAHENKIESHKNVFAKRKNRSNGCFQSGKYYQEGEKLPLDQKRPCEMCYCIKGFRKCVVKKCAPLIRGCIPKIPKEGNCCPTSYDCSRSLKLTRQVRQNVEEDDSDSIDFFSLLFGADEPVEEEESTVKVNVIETTTLQPFKMLSTTEKSFFDLIRAGLEIIDANADNIDSSLNNVVSTPKIIPLNGSTDETDIVNIKNSQTPTEKQFIESTTIKTQPTRKTESTTTTKKLPEKVSTSSIEATTSKSSSTVETASKTKDEISTSPQPDKITKPKVSLSTSKIATTTTATTTTSKLRTTLKPITTVTMTMKTTRERLQETTPKILIQTTSGTSSSTTTRIKPTKFTTSRPPTTTTTATEKPASTTRRTEATTMKSHQILEAIYGAGILPVSKFNENEENEAETLPNIEIIPFVAHDAIDTENYEPYLKPYDNLEKDYFATDKAKPFRYNNKFIHHSYDDSADYAYTNPHERIDNSPYYFDTNDNQFDAFSPPSEQDFLGGFSPKESIYDEVPTIASHELPLKNNEFSQLPLHAVPTIHEHKSNVTSTENTLTFPINQTSHKSSDDAKQHDMIPNFKKISSNFTSFIDDLLQGNVLEETSTKVPTTPTTIAPTSESTKMTTSASTSTSKAVESIINDDDFIIKHFKAPVVPVKAAQSPSRHEIFSKPTSPTMNGLLKLAGCNIYGQMYAVGQIIAELSSECLECKCLPDIGVGCSPKC
ncbi:CLUMA_CG017385, isoform A [Clunio marinus]|uniref:CLUMA_CG017385, isoform A n=1 Tax=Clunio marinus TaxID=568069 RepID=A0A1J1IVT3_9DIPT|nr:CLUMA_CG017385, isoform A [Clunio marinus]